MVSPGPLLNEALMEVAAKRLTEMLETDPELRDRRTRDEVVHQMEDRSLATIEVVEVACKGYADREAFAWCPDATTASFSGRITFEELWRRIQGLATGLSRGGLLQRGDFVATCGFISPDHVIADLSALYLGAPAVPIPLNVTIDDQAHILLDCVPRVMFCSVEELPTLQRVLPMCPCIETLVLMDVPPNLTAITSDREALENLAGGPLPSHVTTVTSVDALVTGGLAAEEGPVAKAVPGKDGFEANPVLSLIYTSGSTGRPKGAMYDDRLLGEFFRRGFRLHRMKLPVVGLGYMPLCHIMGRVLIYASISSGGLMYFLRRPDMTTLLEDLAAARPTSIMLIPRVANMIYEHYQTRLALRRDELGPEPSAEDVAALKAELREEVRQKVTGGRIFFVTTGSAPTAHEVTDFLRETLQVPVVDGYGLTELGGIMIDGRPATAVLEVKLVDCVELGYTQNDHPYPRGELCVKSRTSVSGYYKNPQATEKLIDADGFVHTGDVFEKRGDKYVWIDRINNVLKLSQGEFVVVSRLEVLYAGHPDIEQVYLYGNSLRSYILGVVVPSSAVLCSPVASDKTKLKKRLRAAIESVAKEAGLPSYEVPRDVIVETERFSRANSLLTDSSKPARRNLRERYGPELEELYEEIEAQRQRRLQRIKEDKQATAADKIRAAVEITLGVELEGDLRDYTFPSLGGDSLSAVLFADRLCDLCGVRVPVSAVVHPTHTLASLVEALEGDGETTASPLQDAQRAYVKLHGTSEDLEVVRAADLRLDSLMDPSELTRVETDMREPTVVLLTGGNGFLGRFMLLQLLRKVEGRPGGKVVCLVRAQGDVEARYRLMTVLGHDGTALREQVDALAQHLEVYAGDVSMERLGLASQVYDTLCEEVDTVVHAGAMVNHALSYKELFGPNVLGTVNVMRFCLRGRRKALSFVSTVAVALGFGSVVSEDQLGRDLMEERSGSKRYAAGYGTSKWVCEVLLQDLHERTGVRVGVFRCSMILAAADRALKGQINTADVFTRMLAGIIYTGSAPRSFSTDPGAPAHYDGLPVDLVSSSIVSIAWAAASRGYGRGCDLFHVVNPYTDDGASFDDVVSWVESAGYAIRRTDDYTEWYGGFKRKLEALPPSQKAQSPLAVLHQWAKPKPARGEGTALDATRFTRAVRELVGVDVPRITEEYIHVCLAHMVEAGVIVAPRRENGAA